MLSCPLPNLFPRTILWNRCSSHLGGKGNKSHGGQGRTSSYLGKQVSKRVHISTYSANKYKDPSRPDWCQVPGIKWWANPHRLFLGTFELMKEASANQLITEINTAPWLWSEEQPWQESWPGQRSLSWRGRISRRWELVQARASTYILGTLRRPVQQQARSEGTNGCAEFGQVSGS